MAGFPNQITEPVLRFIRKQCADIAKGYEAVEVDDLVQEVSLAYAQGAHKAENVEAWIRGVAKRQAGFMHEKAMKDKGNVQYFYTSKMVAEILTYAFDYESWDDPSIPIPDSARSDPQKNGGRDTTDIRELCADLMIALDRIGVVHQKRIRAAYQFGMYPSTSSNDYKKLRHAIDILRDKMNALHLKPDPSVDYVGTRKSLPNDTERELIRSEYNGQNRFDSTRHL
jgi:hypothetical protein